MTTPSLKHLEATLAWARRRYERAEAKVKRLVTAIREAEADRHRAGVVLVTAHVRLDAAQRHRRQRC